MPRIKGKKVDRTASVRLDPALVKQVRLIAVREDTTITEFTEEALREKLARTR